jgi:hypothetical protein
MIINYISISLQVNIKIHKKKLLLNRMYFASRMIQMGDSAQTNHHLKSFEILGLVGDISV